MARDLTPSRLWASLPLETRVLAARSYDWKTPETRREADLTIARSLKFREEFVRKLPLEKRIGYIAGAVRPDDPLAASLLLALHLGHRRPMLAAFLDALGIPHDQGVITEDADLTPPAADALARAAASLDAHFPGDEITLYLASLFVIDPETWGGLRDTVESRRAAPADR